MNLDNFAKKYATFVVKHKWIVASMFIILALVLGKGAGNLYFKSNYQVFFGPDNPQLIAFEHLQRTYSKSDNVMFVVQPKKGEVFNQETLQAIKELTKESWQMPYASRVDSITNYQYSYAEGEDELIVEDLIEDPLELNEEALRRRKTIALNEPIILNRLISADSKTTAINVTIQMDEDKPEAALVVAKFARDLRDKILTKYPEHTIAITGVVMLNNAFVSASIQDSSTLVPAMYLVIIIIMYAMLRSVSCTLVGVLVIGFSALIAMGIAGYMGFYLTPPSAIAPTIILTLAVADSIHILVTMLKEMRYHHRKKEEAIIEAIRINKAPVFLTSITTIIGFLSLNFSDSPPFHDLGNIAAMGIAAAYIYSTTFLPAMIAILPVKVKKIETVEAKPLLLEHFANFVIAKRRILLPVMSIIVIGLAILIPKIEVSDRFVEYFDDSIEFRRDTDFANKNLTGIYQVEFDLGSGGANTISSPEYLRNLEKFQHWLEAQPEVSHVNSITDVFKRLNKNMHADDLDYYRIPEDKNLAAQYLLLYEFSLPYGLDLNNQINIHKSATKLTATLYNVSSIEMRSITERADKWLVDNMPKHMHANGVGPAVMFSYIAERNINSMFKGTAASLVLISFILIFALKSLKLGLISLVPNIVPAIMAFGIWYLISGVVGMDVAFVTAMCLGIIVDDTIHFLSKYIRARNEKGMSAEDAVRYSFANVGMAIIITSVIIACGFLVLTLSPFAMNSRMGLLNAIIIIMALIADFLLLPPLLILLSRKDTK
jgi:predicted RND superfamily exporter protein